jgi:hypothetical protein
MIWHHCCWPADDLEVAMTWLVLSLFFALSPHTVRTIGRSEFPVRQGSEQDLAELATLKSAANVERMLAHVSVNDQWKSALLLRSDGKFTQSISLYFYAPDGGEVTVSFRDSDGSEYSGKGFNLSLTGYELYGLEFLSAGSWPSIQVVALSKEEHRFWSIENTYNRYQGNDKLAAVGTLAVEPYARFVLDMDERIDRYSLEQKFRGMAIFNASSASCSCTAYLFDHGANGANMEGAVDKKVMAAIPVNGKWLGYAIDLFPNIDAKLSKGIGYLFFECSQRVAAIGLSFEEGSPAAGSVPVEPFQ